MKKIKSIQKRLINNKLVNDSFWAIIGNVAGKGLSLLAGIVVARILGKDIYGELGIIKSTLLSIALLASFGLGYTATKYISEYKETKPNLIQYIVKITQKITFITSGTLSLLLFISADYFATNILNAPHLGFSLRLIALFVLFNSLTITQIGILAGFGNFRDIAKINTIIGIFTFILSIVLTYIYGLNGSLIALLLVAFINCLLNNKFIKRENKKFLLHEQNKALTKQIIKFSVPVALQEALYSLITWSYGLLIIKLSTYGEMGLYSAALQWSAIILFIPGILRNVILSHMSESLSDLNKHSKILKTILLFNLIITSTFSILFYLFSGYITSLYGSKFIGFEEVLNVTVFTTIFSSLSNVYSQAYMTKNKNWLMLFFRVFRDISIFILTYFLLIKSGGEKGALNLAYSTLITYILFLLIIAVFYEKRLKVKLTF